MEYKEIYTYKEIASDYELFGTYVDPDRTIEEDEFDAMSLEEVVKLIEECCGPEEAVNGEE